MNRTKSHHLAVAALLVAMTASTTGTLASLAVVPASAATTCDVGADFCVVGTQTVQTPLGPATVTVSTTNVVTVQLAPTTPDTLVFGVPFGIPPGPPGYARTSISTTGGLINIDTVLWPQGSPSHFTAPNLAIISIHPPGPCRARTSGMTVVFTPIFPPGPPT